MLGEIRRHFRDHTWTIKVPRSVSELSVRLRSEQSALEQTLGRAPTIPELARALDVDDDAVLDALEASSAYRAESLDLPDDDDAHTPTRGHDPGAHDDELLRVVDREHLRPALAELTQRERDVLRLRFVEERTQAEIAEALGVDQSQVSRLLTRTLLDLRRRLAPVDSVV